MPKRTATIISANASRPSFRLELDSDDPEVLKKFSEAKGVEEYLALGAMPIRVGSIPIGTIKFDNRSGVKEIDVWLAFSESEDSFLLQSLSKM